MLKVAESDYSLTSRDNIGKLFMQMFPGNISNQFQLGRSKASYVVSDGLSPYILEETVKDIKNCGTGYAAMFDEIMTNQNRKQLNVLIRYWCNERKIVSKYLTSVFFGRTTGIDISSNILEAIKETGLPLDKLFGISSDGPNINKTVWREIKDTLKKECFSGIMPQTTCCLHIVHNAFRKRLNMYGEESEELAFDMHYWFKNAPCKHETFLKLEQEMDMEIHQNLFLRHINSQWLTLLPAIERILA